MERLLAEAKDAGIVMMNREGVEEVEVERESVVDVAALDFLDLKSIVRMWMHDYYRKLSTRKNLHLKLN